MPSDAPRRPRPWPDAETAPYWAGTAASTLRLQRCTACDMHRFQPRMSCPACDAEAHDWVPVSGLGTVFSFTVVRRAPSPAFAPDIPYTIAIIALAEGPHMLSRVIGIDPDRVSIGLAVEVAFEAPLDDGLQLPVFRPRCETISASG